MITGAHSQGDAGVTYLEIIAAHECEHAVRREVLF
jgi:hypothetical protein